jgi:release factor glutamine methyltransferase
MHAELTTGHLLADGIRQLTGHAESVQLDAEILLAHTLGVSRARLKSHPEETQTAADAERYRALIARRAEGEPVAYIVGSKGFWTLTLCVTPAVLVPRPETELIVERALELLPADASTGQKGCAPRVGDTALAAPAANMRDPRAVTGSDVGSVDMPDPIRTANLGKVSRAGAAAPVRIADLGTGSGAIALALASERPTWHVTATDVSPEALDVARGNASSLGLNNVRFFQGRWLTPLAGMRFHLIASNPPYVADNDPAMSSPTLRFEPQIALTPGADAMADLREIVQAAPHHLERGGWLLLEHGSDQAAAVTRELVARGFTHVRSVRDLAGHDRMTEAQWAE